MKLSDINYSIALLLLVFPCKASFAERADRNMPIHLEADQVSMDDAKQISTFEGQVFLNQGTMSIRGDKLIVVQDKNGFSHGSATGNPASFRQKREGYDEYVEGYAGRIEYDTQTETVDFIGHARMTKKQDEVRGDHITYNSRTEIFQVHSAQNQPVNGSDTGRVHVTLQPKGVSITPAAGPLSIKPSENLSHPEGGP